MNRLWKFNCRLAGRKIDGGEKGEEAGPGFTEVYRNSRTMSARGRSFLSGDIRVQLQYTSLVRCSRSTERDAEFLIAPTRTAVYTHRRVCILHVPRVFSILSLLTSVAILTYGFRYHGVQTNNKRVSIFQGMNLRVKVSRKRRKERALRNLSSSS